MSFYDEMQGVATELLTEFDQGGLAVVSPGSSSGDPWNPQPGADVIRRFKGVLRGVSAQYVDGSLVLATDLQCTAPAFADGHEPTLSDTLSNNGAILQIVKVERIPAATAEPAIAWRIFCRA